MRRWLLALVAVLLVAGCRGGGVPAGWVPCNHLRDGTVVYCVPPSN